MVRVLFLALVFVFAPASHALDPAKLARKFEPAAWSNDEADTCAGYFGWRYNMSVRAKIESANKQLFDYATVAKDLWDQMAATAHEVSIAEFRESTLPGLIRIFETATSETRDFYFLFCDKRLREHVETAEQINKSRGRN